MYEQVSVHERSRNLAPVNAMSQQGQLFMCVASSYLMNTFIGIITDLFGNSYPCGNQNLVLTMKNAISGQSFKG